MRQSHSALMGLIFLKPGESGGNKLTSLILPPGLTNLASLFLAGNQLTDLTLPSDLFHLAQIDLG